VSPDIPAAFAISAGYGDLIAATLALLRTRWGSAFFCNRNANPSCNRVCSQRKSTCAFSVSHTDTAMKDRWCLRELKQPQYATHLSTLLNVPLAV